MTRLKVSKKSKRKSGSRICSCGHEKEVTFAGDGVEYPVFACPDCGPDKRNEWALWWSDYRFLWQDNAKWDEQKHKLPCLMGYFCAKYAELYGHPFRFDYAATKPYTSKDFIMGGRLLAMFDGDAKAARTYVKWVFVFKIKNTNCAIRSMGFFVSQKFVAEYMQARARARVLRRSTPLPTEFIEWCLMNEPNVFEHQELETWNDLNFLVTYVRQNGHDNIEGMVAAEAVRRGMLSPGPGYANLED